MGNQTGSGLGMNSPQGSGQGGSTSSMFGNPGDVQGAFIAGVAATTHHESIKIWQKHHHYDEWEFLGIDMGIFGIQVGMPGGGGSSGNGMTGFGQQQQNMQGFGSSQGNMGSSNSNSNFGSSSN
jgi:hypothetical protein